MSGTGYDIDASIYSPEGKIFQVEYAQKCVDNAETIIGFKCKDGIIIGAEKQVFSKMLVQGTNRRIYNIDESIGAVISGKIPDGRHIIERSRKESAEYLKNFAIPMTGTILSDRIGQYVHNYTQYSSVRPFGSSVIIGSFDEEDGYKLHMIEPSGLTLGYHVVACGKGKSIAQSEFEKRNITTLTCQQAIVWAAKVLKQTHDEFKDKQFEYEFSWISNESKNVHQFIPKDLKEFADQESDKLIEKEEMGQ